MNTYLHVQAYGNGPHAFLGIPGFGATHVKSFAGMLNLIPPEVTFYGIDPPGLGLSPDPEAWTWEAITDHLLEVVDAVASERGEKVTLVGACSGSFHAMELAKRRPEAIEELVLLEPFGYTPWFLRTFLIPKFGFALFHAIFGTPRGRAFLTRLLSIGGVARGYSPIESFADVPSSTPHHYLRLYGERERLGAEQFGDISAPKRVIHGTRTFGAVTGSIALWRRIWGEVEVIAIEDVGHQLTQDKPAEVNALLFERFTSS